MKKYITKIIVLFIAVSIPLVAFIVHIFFVPDGMSDTIAATLRYKIPLVEHIESPKIIMTGGSSSPYGVNCQQISEGTGMNCLCLGATAYLGKDIYFKILENNAVPGDIVVLGFENMLLFEKSIDYNLVWQAAGNDSTVWKNIPASYYPGMFTTAIGYYQTRLKYSVNGWTEGHHGDFGPLGDVTLVREAILESGYNRQDLRQLDLENVSDKELKAIKNFSSKMAKKGVKVYFAYAPLDKLCITSTEEEIHQYAQYIEDYLDIPVVVSIDDAIMEGKYFYNTNNHLTTEGASIYSDCVIRGINSLQ